MNRISTRNRAFLSALTCLVVPILCIMLYKAGFDLFGSWVVPAIIVSLIIGYIFR